MNININKLLLSLLCIFCLCSCNDGGRNNKSEEPNYDDVNFKYTWNLKKNNAYNDVLEICASSTNPTWDDLILKVNDTSYIETIPETLKATFNYIGYDVKGDNAYNAADYFYLNGEKLGRMPSNGEKGFTIDEKLFLAGENIVTVTIGRLWSDREYNPTDRHGNEYQSCDDYRLENFHFTRPSGEILYPTKVVKYYPKEVGVPAVKSQEIVTENFDPTIAYWVGDGWADNDSYYGHSNSRLNIPYKMDFIFDYEDPAYFQFIVDTKDFKDDYYSLNLYEGQEHVQHAKVVFDNTIPEITTSIKEHAILNKNTDRIVSSFADTTAKLSNQMVLIDGNVSLKNASISNLSEGWHNLTLFARDNAGNYAYRFIPFYAGETGKFNADTSISKTEVIVTSKDPFTSESYNASLLKTSSFYANDLANQTVGSLPLISNETTAMPYHYFETTVTDVNKQLIINYQGQTHEGERIALKVYNYTTSSYDILATGFGDSSITLQLDPKNYVDENNILKTYVTLDYVNNGSDTIIWSTDPQSYTKFEDLNAVYYQIMEYSADLYEQGKAGYLIQTGDLVEDYLGKGSTDKTQKELVYGQWDVADKAHKILDDAGMPYGISTGNHDTGTALESLNYEQYWEFFGNFRYNTKPWFGDSINNNASHYDLITINNTDFIILYLGYGVEADLDTINFANYVLKKYSNRNAILCTHSYLNTTGVDETSRYYEIYNQIVVPNDNVLMVLCGHNSGAYRRIVNINDNREVHEILSDYQFVDEEPHKHYIGTTAGCSGDGWIRLLTFNGNKMSTISYSPYRDKYNHFGNNDNFQITLKNMKDNNRYLSTTNYEIYSIGSATSIINSENNKVTVNNSGNDLIIKVYDNNNNVNYLIITE